MLPKFALAACALLLSACATVTSETTRSITVDGRSYDVRERTLEGPNGSFKQTSVRVNGIHALCLIDSPGDCEAAVRRERDRFDRF